VAHDNPQPLIPAATVILLRASDPGVEVLILRRNRALKSFGGAWVFPGGRVDPSDLPGGLEIERAKAAAIRETAEEAGLDISQTPLVPVSQWIPPVQEKLRFSTWFFMAEAPDKRVEVDQGEIHDFQWINPKQVMSQAPDPGLILMPPTYISLHDLAGFETVSEAMSTLQNRPAEIFETRFVKQEDGFTTLWEGDIGYESLDLSLEGPRRRLVARPSAWTYYKGR